MIPKLCPSTSLNSCLTVFCLQQILQRVDQEEVHQEEVKRTVAFQEEVEEDPIVHLLQSEQLIAAVLPPVLLELGVVLASELIEHAQWHGN